MRDSKWPKRRTRREKGGNAEGEGNPKHQGCPPVALVSNSTGEGGALAQKQEAGGSCVPWQAQEVLWWLKQLQSSMESLLVHHYQPSRGDVATPTPPPHFTDEKTEHIVGVSHTGHPIRNQESRQLLWGLSLSSWVTLPPHISSFASLSC